MENMVRIDREALERFCSEVFLRLGLTREEAADSASILVSADARGIGSHGTARLWRYVNGLRNGIMQPRVEPITLRDTPLSLVLDADGAMGMALSKRTMGEVIKRAGMLGAAFASIRNSNHFGIAGYYSEMAAKAGMIGISMTNTAALGVPTFGRSAMFGTNPIAVSVPASKGRMFSLDMATTCVTRGKVEVYAREGAALPAGWAVDTDGRGTGDAKRLLEDMLFQRGGGLLPLGGEGELLGGHKGYGLAVLVDILTAVTSGGAFGKAVKDSEQTSARVCHFFGALRVDLFRDPEAFKDDMGRLLDELATGELAEGAERIYYAGLKEHEAQEESERLGVPLAAKVANLLRKIGEEMAIEFPHVDS